MLVGTSSTEHERWPYAAWAELSPLSVIPAQAGIQNQQAIVQATIATVENARIMQTVVVLLTPALELPKMIGKQD